MRTSASGPSDHVLAWPERQLRVDSGDSIAAPRTAGVGASRPLSGPASVKIAGHPDPTYRSGY